MRRINAAYLFVGISLLAGASWATWSTSQNPNNHPKEQKSKSKAISVAVAEVQQRDVDVVVSAVGTVAAKNTVVVKNRIAGELKALYFQEGDWVKAGQLLAQIDDRQWQAQLKQVQGQVARNLALLKNAQLDLQRYRDLAQQQLVSQQQIEAQKALVEQYQGTVLSDQGVLEHAKLQLSYCQIKAANSGRIGLRQVDVGNQLAADSTLAVIHQLQPAQVLFSLPDNQLASTPNRSTLKVEAWDKNQQQNLAIGQIVAVDNQVEANTGSIKIKAEFANQQQQLLPNQFVNLRVKFNTLKQAHVIL